MNIFDIVGPVMVGPSSSHTAGAARIGYTVRVVLGEPIKKAKIYFHGSFAQTYKGHGSDKAVIGGLLGYKPDDPRIKNSMEDANTLGMKYSFEKIEIFDAHPNTILIQATGQNGEQISLQGASVGGGNVIIQKFNNIPVDFRGNYDTLLIEQEDAPGAVAAVTNFIAAMKINIANMKVFRAQKGGGAIMIIETDSILPVGICQTISSFQNIKSVRHIQKIT